MQDNIPTRLTCDLIPLGASPRGYAYHCAGCGRGCKVAESDPNKIHRPCRPGGHLKTKHPPAPLIGPGYELAALLRELGLNEKPGCGCGHMVTKMNRWGVDGCREHREEIIGWLREAADKVGWVSPLEGFNPFPDLVDEAIRRAEAKA